MNPQYYNECNVMLLYSKKMQSDDSKDTFDSTSCSNPHFLNVLEGRITPIGHSTFHTLHNSLQCLSVRWTLKEIQLPLPRSMTSTAAAKSVTPKATPMPWSVGTSLLG
jgi:hypothetical protein